MTCSLPRTLIIGTSNRGFAPLAQEEIRRLFSGARFSPFVPGETFLVDIPEERSWVLSRIVDREPIFLRHVQPVDAQWECGSAPFEWEQFVPRILSMPQLGHLPPTAKVAVHIQKSEGAPFPDSAGALRQRLEVPLRELFQARLVTQEPDWILSLFAAKKTIYAGLSRPWENLSDWPGGAVRFRKEEGLISRAKFKLLEAEKKFGIDFGSFQKALDIGAAPGGWTSFLLERGMEVTAVDPAPLHPSLIRHPKVRHIPKKAGEVEFSPESFDLLVCDMNWNPYHTAKLLLPLTDALAEGGTVLMTLKLMAKKPFKVIREIVELLETRLVLKKVKQLFHNREEVTLWMEKMYNKRKKLKEKRCEKEV